MTGATLGDLRRNPKIRFSDILKQFGQSHSSSRVLLEQEFLKHRLVDGDHLPEIGSVEVHEHTRVDVCFDGIVENFRHCRHAAAVSYLAGMSQYPSVRNRTTE